MSKTVIPLTVILVGQSGVGKTCLANQLVNNCFDESTESTSGTDLFRYKMDFDEYIVDLTLKDTCGQEQYRSLVGQFYRETQGAFIVYDITSRNSFEIVQDWITDVSSYCPQGVKVMIIGNKIDLEMDAREVSYDEGEEYAKERGYAFFETSAKMNVKVEDSFRGLISTIIQSKNFTEETVQPTNEKIVLKKETGDHQVEGKKGGCC
ncbi:Rab family GTPase [Entamoeba marina]